MMSSESAGPSKPPINNNQSYLCVVCDTNVQEDCRVSHENGKRHQTNLAQKSCTQPNIQPNILPDPSNDTYVYVHGYTDFTRPEQLLKFFLRFGPVRLERMNPRYAVLKYERVENALAAISDNKKIFYGSRLTIRKYNVPENNVKSIKQKQQKPGFVKTKAKEKIVQPSEIDLSGDFYSQCDRILAAIRLTREEVEGLSQLYDDLRVCLSEIWPGCEAFAFGSIITGLGIKTSDADCFINLPPQYRITGSTQVQRAKKVLQKYPGTFTELLSIPNANTPIVKLFHIPTSMNCDVSFKTPLGVRNSSLLAFLLSNDPRLLPLVLLIKYFFKVHGLSGTGRLSNYALTMMIIFYVQIMNDPILPPLCSLQKDKKFDVFVDCWNTGFQEIRKPNKNLLSLEELFGGFFIFYRNFDFEKFVICPYMGIPLLKDLFDKQLHLLPEEFALYRYNVEEGISLPLRTNRCWCVQDPFEQCHNVATGVSTKMAFEFQSCIKWAADCYTAETNNKGNLLRKILLEKFVVCNKPEFHINIILGAYSEVDKDLLKDVFLQVFDKIYHFKMTPKTEEQNKKEDEPSSKRSRVSYLAETTYMLWRKRHIGKIYKSMQIPCLEKEMRTSGDLLKIDEPTYKIDLAVTIKFTMRGNKAVIFIKWERGGENGVYEEFGRFASVNLQFLFLELLADQCPEIGKNGNKNPYSPKIIVRQERSLSKNPDSNKGCKKPKLNDNSASATVNQNNHQESSQSSTADLAINEPASKSISVENHTDQSINTVLNNSSIAIMDIVKEENSNSNLLVEDSPRKTNTLNNESSVENASTTPKEKSDNDTFSVSENIKSEIAVVNEETGNNVCNGSSNTNVNDDKIESDKMSLDEIEVKAHDNMDKGYSNLAEERIQVVDDAADKFKHKMSVSENEDEIEIINRCVSNSDTLQDCDNCESRNPLLTNES